jgi:hypothetical protein
MPLKRPRAVVVVWIGLLFAATLGLMGCGAEPIQPVGTGPATTSTVTTSGATTVPGAASEATTSTEMYYSMTTSAAFGIATSQGMELIPRLGDAVISYLSGEGDLAAVQALVAPSALEGLSQMLATLDRPTRCELLGMSNYGLSNETEGDLLFAGGTSEPAHFFITILFDPDTSTITIMAISPDPMVDPRAPVTTTVSTTVTTILDGSAAGSSLPVIQIQAEPKLDYMSYPYSYFTAEAVALAKVIEVLPLRRNPLAGSGDSDGPNEHQPIVYKGYVLEVEKAYGPDTIPKRITVYALGNGTVLLDGVTYKVREEFPLDVSPGDKIFVPLVKVSYFGTPDLKQDEYWVQANWAVFAVDDSGTCTRVTGADLDPETRSEFPLPFLENAAAEQGKQPSVVH